MKNTFITPDSLEEVTKALDLLNARGFILDEDKTFIDSCAIESHSNELEVLFRQYGYSGGPLHIHGKHYDSHGSVYAIFNFSAISHELIEKLMDEHVEEFKLEFTGMNDGRESQVSE